jgi:hypothetical protein
MSRRLIHLLSRTASTASTFRALLLVAGLTSPVEVGQAQARPTVPTPEEHSNQAENRAPRVKIPLSKETTRILGPIGKDGFVDYLAAVNLLGSAGVTPENNAAVLFAQALGVKELQGADRDRFFLLLGIKTLPEQGAYFKELPEALSKNNAAVQTALVEPWKARDLPKLADWLKSNEGPLALLVAGTRRERCYIPWVLSPGESLETALMPIEQASRQAGWALVVRAMLRLAEGNVASAQEDVLACHRLSRLIGNGPCMLDVLVCAELDSLAFDGDAALMEHGKLSAADALAYQAKLRALPPLPIVAEKFDRCERFIMLDQLHTTVRKAMQEPRMDALARSDSSQLLLDRMAAYATGLLQAGNEEWDKWSSAARLPPSSRQRLFDVLWMRLQQETSKAVGQELFEKIKANPAEMKVIPLKLRDRVLQMTVDPDKATNVPGLLFNATTPREYGRLFGKFFVCVTFPAINLSAAAEGRARARSVIEQVGFAIVAYRADHGHYPTLLRALVPKYLATAPEDPRTGEPLLYGWRGEAIWLHSPIPNDARKQGQKLDPQAPRDEVVLWLPRKGGFPKKGLHEKP